MSPNTGPCWTGSAACSADLDQQPQRTRSALDEVCLHGVKILVFEMGEAAGYERRQLESQKEQGQMVGL